MFYCTFQHDRSNAACLRHGRHSRRGNQTERVRSHAHTVCDRAKLLWKQSHVNWLRYAHTITWFHFLFGFECVRLPYFSRAQPIRLPVTHKKAIVFFSLSLLFCLGKMKWVWFFFLHIHSPSCEHHYAWPYTKCYSFALYPILCLFCHTNCLLEKPLKKFSSGTLERQNFHAFLLGMKKISLLWFWVWLDQIDACICRNRNEWWCNTVERIEMRLFIHKLYWHWRTSHSKSCIYPSDNDVAIIHVEAK